MRQGDDVPPSERIEPILSLPGREILDTLGKICRRYNRRSGKHRHFYGHPAFGGSIKRDQRRWVRALNPDLNITARRWR